VEIEMDVIHGTWFHDAAGDFVQKGSFCLWVETSLPALTPALSPQGRASTATKKRGASRRSQAETAAHPRHLRGAALEAFLSEKLSINESYVSAISEKICTRSLLLPSVDGAPVPSFELLRDAGDEAPEEFTFLAWEIVCYSVSNVITTLNDIYVAALQPDTGFELGSDLRFWHQFSRVLKQVIARDQYLPALTYRELAPETGKRRKSQPQFAIEPAWELVSEEYEAAIARYAAAMPPVCAAGAVESGKSGETELFDSARLLRHFSECLLNEVVTGTPLTAKLDQQIAGTLLYNCFYPYRPASRSQTAEAALEEYRRWAVWRTKLTEAQTGTGFTLCFRLEEAPADDTDNWWLRFLVASKRDASFKLDLAEYWALDAAGQQRLLPYLGAEFERNLLLALGHAARIEPKLWHGLETDRPAGLRLTLEEAFAFLTESAWVLEDAGCTVIVPAWYTPEGRRRARIRLKTSAARGKAASPKGYFSMDALVAYRPELSIGGETVSEEEWRQLVAAKTPLVQFRGQWMELDRERMQRLLSFWQERQQTEPELTLQELLRAQAEGADDLEWDHDAAVQAMVARLHDKSAMTPISDPPLLCGSLREYQRRGVAWLRYLESLGLNACLADDMGLGKTLEVIAHLLAEREEKGPERLAPTLVIAPTSVVGNWQKEIARFAPSLRTLVHHGAARLKQEQPFHAACLDADVVITSYALARLDEKLLRGVEWRRVVVDEAQNIKNPETAQARVVGKLRARHRLALTGTPVENRLLDLWSIFNFLNPGYLGKQAQFRKGFELPIQRNNDRARSQTLKKLVEPFILRRVKTDPQIIDDLPEKVEQKMFCNLTPEQASLYEAIVKDASRDVDEVEGIERRGLILATLMKLKQVCNHPAQFLQDGSAFTSERSHKLRRLTEMIEEVIASGESALVFTQFAELGRQLEAHIARTLHCTVHFLHGGTSAARRERMIAAFQDPESEPSIFILSLRAGGVGINLTRANHVFHFDRWWNPAVEDQATDRAFRIGQRKNVFVHKFVAIGTLEERIDQMIEEKRRISGAIIGADESWLADLDNETFKSVIALQRSAVLE
jgi:SNF2 family DNA or RNA helicase